MIGPVVERVFGQGVDQPRGGPGVVRRLDAVEVADAEGLRRWLAHAPEDRVLVQVLPFARGILVLFRDPAGDARGH